ncbi:hypothetical protein [Sinorhizobium fredii]|uniref:hypothetical protein n=1 Tax=Rhizobium fredii TaxID=380 RepID=UPI00210C1961|nr:hypothetical protein [Sinorhizobium fredii]UTY47278.1 hypothetical protein EPK84_11060 [Sinorhizobium fredii]
MTEPLPFSIEAPRRGEKGQMEKLETDACEYMQRIHDDALQVVNRLEAIYAQLHPLVHGTSPIAAVPKSEK